MAVDGPNTIDVNTLVWDANADPQDPTYYVEFEGATGPVVYNGKDYAYARYYDEGSVDTNSQIIAYSVEVYTTKANAINGIVSVKENAPTASIEDQTV